MSRFYRALRYDVYVVKVRDLVRMLESAGWRLKATRGSHQQFRHPEKGMVVTVAGKPGNDIPIGTLKAILRSAGLNPKGDNE
jgi:predicted RNA binding protein YcfA (HicA-like mRNA interferase family)